MEKQSNYYGSDINRYIGECLPRIMTTINVDLFQLKQSRKIIRIAEYKHLNEGMGDKQEKALLRLGKIANIINENSELFGGWTMQVLLIRGNKPFDHIEVMDFITGVRYECNDKEKINKFLTMEVNNG